jgi:phosphohistidine phosphatase
MRRLLLLRHAKTETDAPSGRDQDRRLDARGHRDAAEIGAWIGTHPPFPDHVMVSPALRAVQTWDISWEAMKEHAQKPRIELVPELYGADATQLLLSIRMASTTDPKQLLLVGHNPGMHELALALIGTADLGACPVRLCDRRLERRGLPPRAADALCQPEAVEAGIERLVPPI